MMPPSKRRRVALAAATGAVLLAGWALARLLGRPLGDTAGGLVGGLGVGALVAAVMLALAPGDPGACGTPEVARRYRREMGVVMGVYVGVMLFWRRLLGLVELPWLRVLVALLPALLVLLTIRAMVRYVRDSDELQRRIELESVAIAACIVGGAYMTAGFLQSARVIDVPSPVAMLWVFPSLCFAYGMVKLVIARRYA